MIRSPQQLMQEIILPKSAELKLAPEAVDELMISTWVAEYVPLKLAQTESKEVEVTASADPAPTPVVSGGIDSLWGDDLSADDFSEFVGGVDLNNSSTTSSTTTPKTTEIAVIEGSTKLVNPHVSEQLTNTQLQRVGFSGGGLVITFLNSQLDALGTSVKIGSQITFGGRTYRVIETKALLYWKYLDKNLYTVANCEE